ncbi:MAG: type II toxin-antitoxin system MqsA family antitoxin [Nitrospirota bacterium]
MKAKKCPVCGIGTLRKEVGTETFEYKDMTTTVPNYITFKCGECGEAIVDKATLKESGRILKDFQRQVDGMLTGEEIKRIRTKLNLTQEEMAEIVGGGLKGIARYESRQVCQSKGMDNLLRILDAYPFTLNVIQKNQVKKLALHMQKKVITFEDFKALKRYKTKTKEYSIKVEGVAYGT